ncbi:MAG: hypothetical protein U0354_11155 [Candidatus Sericytochromatia bacterium]
MKKKYLTLLSLILIGCGQNINNTTRKNPEVSDIIKSSSPSAIASKFIPPSGNLSDELPDPIKTDIPNIEDYTFDINIIFNTRLGRVRVNDGEILNTPVLYKLKGGRNKIEVFDLVTYCRFADIFFIDKNQTIDLTKKCE